MGIHIDVQNLTISIDFEQSVCTIGMSTGCQENMSLTCYLPYQVKVYVLEKTCFCKLVDLIVVFVSRWARQILTILVDTKTICVAEC